MAYVKAQADYLNIVSSRTVSAKADSVLKELLTIRERKAGTRKVYYPSPDFISYDSMLMLDYPAQITSLSITNIKTKRLPKEVFNCNQLQFLELVNTPIRNLQKLKKLPHLKSVYILNSKSLKPIRLSKTGGIKSFGMRGENPAALPRSFHQVSKLEKLDLADNRLTHFPTGIKKNLLLKEILLSNNHITLEDGRMEESASLEKLELQKNKIITIPSAIKGYPNLKKLTLSYNAIEKVSDEISTLSKLEHLAFYHNNLTSIPDGIFKLKDLKDIDLYFNRIERMDNRLGKLKSLEVLYLSNNKLISIPDSIGSLTNLRELYLSNNRLSDLPQSLGKLHELKVLRLNNNYLLQFPEYLLKLSKLENIDISNNKITELPEYVSSLQQLKLLVMVNNPWDSQSLERLPKLTEQLRKKEVVVHARLGRNLEFRLLCRNLGFVLLFPFSFFSVFVLLAHQLKFSLL